MKFQDAHVGEIQVEHLAEGIAQVAEVKADECGGG